MRLPLFSVRFSPLILGLRINFELARSLRLPLLSRPCRPIPPTQTSIAVSASSPAWVPAALQTGLNNLVLCSTLLACASAYATLDTLTVAVVRARSGCWNNSARNLLGTA